LKLSIFSKTEEESPSKLAISLHQPWFLQNKAGYFKEQLQTNLVLPSIAQGAKEVSLRLMIPWTDPPLKRVYVVMGLVGETGKKSKTRPLPCTCVVIIIACLLFG
jgi:hypothetical protein